MAEADVERVDDAIWMQYVCGGATEALVSKVTQGVVNEANNTSLECATEIGHMVMVQACQQVAAATKIVAPLVYAAANAYEGTFRDSIICAKSRPVLIPGSGACTLIVDGRYHDVTASEGNLAIAFYVASYPWTDIVVAATPKLPPNLSTQDKVYEFIGTRFSTSIIESRAHELRDAVRLLLCGQNNGQGQAIDG